jgi:hypothetical protein
MSEGFFGHVERDGNVLLEVAIVVDDLVKIYIYPFNSNS